MLGGMIARAIVAVVMLVGVVVQAVPVEVGEGREPQVAVEGRNVYLVYGRGEEVWFARSEDGGRTFGAPAVVARVGHLMLGMRRGPRVAVGGEGVIVVTAVADQRAEEHGGDLLAWRSGDGGRTWAGPVRVNDVPGAAREGLQHVAGDGKGRVYAVWLDLRTGHTRVVGALSRDGGSSWGGNEVIYESPGGHTCECCQPSVVFLPDGRVGVMFRNFLGGNRDMYWGVFEPGAVGVRGVKIEAVDPGVRWKLNACPMDGGALSVDGGERVVAVWQSQGKVYVTRKGEGSRVVGDGGQGWVAGEGVVWTTGRVGKLLYREGVEGEAVEVAGKATDPVVAGVGGGVVCAWGANGKVYASVISGEKGK